MNKRVIRFRAWDGEKMSTFTLDIDSVGYLTKPPVPPKHFDFTKNGFKELMQYTGLHDKNGKEIYEGDVLKWKGHNIIAKTKYTSTGEVMFDKGAFIVRTPEQDEDEGAYLWTLIAEIGFEENKDCEIIGNRFENPELIDKLK